MSYIEFRQIDKSFGSNQVLKGIDLQIEKGQFVTLLGSSGCGKSTLIQPISQSDGRREYCFWFEVEENVKGGHCCQSQPGYCHG